jgi:ADP-L-glycero-D-manno-heptose 6-epimerase
MNIITGHKGFIGSNLTKVIDNYVGVEINDCFEFLENFDDWKNVNCIYHIGAISDTTETNTNRLYTYNVDFTIRLFERAIQYDIPVKYASTAAVYGNSNILNPLNQYAASKVLVDLWVQDHLHHFNFIQGFRFFNVYGHGEDHKKSQASPINQFIKQVKDTGQIKIFEGSEVFERDFVCVDDVCNIVKNNRNSSGIYDVGTGRPVSFKNIALLIKDLFGGEIVEIPFPQKLKGRYQYYTCARQHFNYNYKNVKDWLLENFTND